MGNCLMLLGLRKLKRPVTLLLVGLDNAGKTTAAKGIVGESVENIAPTVGFNPETLEYRGCEITIYDLGGGSRIRAVWPKYFSEVHGVIFVIDSSDKSRIEECHEVLENLLSHQKVSGKPVLVLANKQDVEGALDEIDIVESLKIEQIVNAYKCPTRVETCSAITIRKKKPEKSIADGFRWLIDTIVLHYGKLHSRVEKDVIEERQQRVEEMERRKERLKKLRAEQEHKNAEEMAKGENVNNAVEDSDDDMIIVKKEVRAETHQLSVTRETMENQSINHLPSQESKEQDGGSLNSSMEAQELKELGIAPSSLLNSSTSSSSSLVSYSVSLTTKRAESSKEQGLSKLIVVQASPSQNSENIPTSCIGKENEPMDNSQAACSPTFDGSKLTNKIEPMANGLINNDQITSRSSECVHIDSDDEMFASITGNTSRKNGYSTNYSPRLSNGSITAGIKEQIELEASLYQKPKRKNFLKRLHKTAPFIPAAPIDTSSNVISVTSTEPP